MHATQIYIASQTVRELIVVDPPYSLLSTIFAIIGLLALIGGFFVLSFLKVGFARPLQIFAWLIPILIASPFLIVALVTGATTRIIVSADTGTLSARKTILSVPVRSKEYPLAEVRMVNVGVGNVCRFLYVSLEGKQAEDLTGCTDRTGYGEAANAMNAFLEANRH